MQLKFALSGRIHSIGALSSRFLIAGSSTGSVDVISLWKDNDSQEIEDTFEATSIPVRVGCQPPLPNADGLSASIGPVTIIRGLSRYNPTNQSTCMFALAWVDGRICICNLAKNPKSNLSESEPSHLGLSLPLNYSWDWRVIQTFHTKYSLFRLDYVRFKSAIDQPKSSVQSTTVDDLSYSEHKYQDLELNWQSVHGDIEEEETSDHQACEEAYIVASSHTGHTLFITVLPSDLGESTSAADDHQIRKIFSFDSRHSLHGEIVRYIAIGRLNHISPAQNCPLQSSDETPAINSFSMVYLTSSGDIWIVNNVEWELAILGPPIIPSVRFSSSDIDRANRIVRMWNIMRSGPVSKGDVIDSAQQDGVQLIQRLLSTSLTDLKRMVEETSLDSWHRSHS